MLKLSLFIYLLNFEVFCISLHIHNTERTEDSWNSVHYKDGQHNREYDHEAILGTKEKAHEFDELSPVEAKRRLRILINKGIDANSDGFVDEKELTEWVLASFKTLALEEGAERFIEEDTNKDGSITWNEHINANFEDGPFSESDDMVIEDKVLWQSADVNGDGLLDVNEFSAFNSPEDYGHMHAALVRLTMDRRDSDQDGYLSFHEFVKDERGEIPDKNSETYIIEKERFERDFDLDKDNLLSKNEVHNWIIPDSRESAESEAIHLISNCDDNNDGKLSIQEIIDHHDIFVGSEATDYGERLQRIHDEL